MLKRDLVSTHLRRGTALVLAASVAGIAGIAQAGPTKGGTLTVGLETDVRGFDTVKGGVYGISGRTVAGALEVVQDGITTLVPVQGPVQKNDAEATDAILNLVQRNTLKTRRWYVAPLDQKFRPAAMLANHGVPTAGAPGRVRKP